MLGGLLTVSVRAQDNKVFRDSPQVKAAFRKVVDQARQCVVEVVCQAEGDEKPVTVALGTIVGTDGWIVTKASELRGRITCKLREKGQHAARLIGVSDEYDLAMLKIDADDLPVVVFDAAAKYAPGQWVATAGTSEDPLAVGVVSVVRREIPKSGGRLGIKLTEENTAKKGDGPKIETIDDGSAAKKAGLKVGDVITHINGKQMAGNEQLVRTVSAMQAGTTIKLTVRRGDEYLTIHATLQSRPAGFQDQLGQTLSKRAAGFPAALQHDTVLKPSQCGGPLVGLQGKVLGLNIARAGRVVSYAVPSDVVVGLLSDLKSGKLAPSAAMLAAVTPPRGPLEAPSAETRPVEKEKEMTQGSSPPGVPPPSRR
jgi:serine protease Do